MSRASGGTTPIFDDTTGAYSIEYFEQQLQAQIPFAVRHELHLAVVLIAIDRAGELATETRDRILRTVAGVVREHIRDEDVLARYGAAEFALLCMGTSAAEAQSLGARVAAAVGSTDFRHDGLDKTVTISVGISDLDPEADKETSMMERAEAALAKARSANQAVQ